MVHRKQPNRERWEGWVMFAWVLAAIAAISGVVLISAYGQIEVPSGTDFRGNVRWDKQANVLVWTAAIGQALGTIMLAVIFSIINSIYQNSCDLINNVIDDVVNEKNGESEGGGLLTIGSKKTSGSESLGGLKITKVRTASPFDGILHPGYLLLSINGHKPMDGLDAAKQVIDGENEVIFQKPDGELVKRIVPMRPGPLHMTVES